MILSFNQLANRASFGMSFANTPLKTNYVQLKKEIMKKLMIAACLMLGGASLATAQEQSTPQTQSQTSQDQDRGQQISVSELPDGVTAQLESQDYSGWTVGNAYKKTDDSQRELYVVELRQGTETKKVKFDSDGNKIEKGDMHKDEAHKDKSESQNYNDASDKGTESSTETEETESATDESETDQADNSDLQDPQ
jgi:hypothetical protein